MFTESLKEILTFWFFDLASCSRLAYGFWIFSYTDGNDTLIFCMNILKYLLFEMILASCYCFIFEFLCSEDTVYHGLCPGSCSVFILYDRNKLSEVMGITENVHTFFKREVWHPVVMDHFSEKSNERSHVHYSLSSSFPMSLVYCQEFRTGNMYPMSLSGYTSSCLIIMLDIAFIDSSTDTLRNRIESCISFFVEFHETGLAQRESKDLLKVLSYSLIGNYSIVVEICGMCFDIWSNLDITYYSMRKH